MDCCVSLLHSGQCCWFCSHLHQKPWIQFPNTQVSSLSEPLIQVDWSRTVKRCLEQVMQKEPCLLPQNSPTMNSERIWKCLGAHCCRPKEQALAVHCQWVCVYCAWHGHSEPSSSHHLFASLQSEYWRHLASRTRQSVEALHVWVTNPVIVAQWFIYSLFRKYVTAFTNCKPIEWVTIPSPLLWPCWVYQFAILHVFIQILAGADCKDTVRNCLVSKGPLLLIASVYRCPAKFRSIAHCTKSLAKESCEPLVMADWTRLVVDGSGLSLRVVKPGRGNSHVRIHHCNNSLSSRAGSLARPGRPLRHDIIFCFVSFFWTGSRWRN